MWKIFKYIHFASQLFIVLKQVSQSVFSSCFEEMFASCENDFCTNFSSCLLLTFGR